MSELQSVVDGSRILEDLMGGVMPDEKWMQDYMKFRDGVAILMRGYNNITAEEMDTLKVLVLENPAFLMVVAGHYKININFTPVTETE